MFYAGCQWAILIVLAKLGSPTVVGEYALAMAIVSPIFSLSNLQLRNIQATDARHEFTFSVYYTLRLLTTSTAVLLLAVFSVVLAGVGTTQACNIMGIVMALGIAKGIESFADICYGHFQKCDQMHLISTSMMAKSGIALSSMALIFTFTDSLVLGICGISISYLAVIVYFDFPQTVKMLSDNHSGALPRVCLENKKLRSLLFLGLPMGGVIVLVSLYSSLPRLMIESQISIEQLGIFSAIAWLMLAGWQVISALGQSLSSSLARSFCKGERQRFYRLSLIFLAISILLGLSGVAFSVFLGKAMLHILYGEVYSAQSNVLVILMIACLLSYVVTVFGVALTSCRCMRPQIAIPLVGIVFLLIFGIPLTRNHGLEGIAWAISIGYLAQVVACAIIAIYFVRFPQFNPEVPE